MGRSSDSGQAKDVMRKGEEFICIGLAGPNPECAWEPGSIPGKCLWGRGLLGKTRVANKVRKGGGSQNLSGEPSRPPYPGQNALSPVCGLRSHTDTLRHTDAIMQATQSHIQAQTHEHTITRHTSTNIQGLAHTHGGPREHNRSHTSTRSYPDL